MSAGYRWLVAEWTRYQPRRGRDGVAAERVAEESDYGHDPVRSGRDIRCGRDLHVVGEKDAPKVGRTP